MLHVSFLSFTNPLIQAELRGKVSKQKGWLSDYFGIPAIYPNAYSLLFFPIHVTAMHDLS